MIMRMFRTLVRTSWQHMLRTRALTVMVIGAFTVLFLTVLVGLSMMKLLQDERRTLAEKFTYPLFINTMYTFESQRVHDFVQSLPTAGVSGELEYVSKETALDQEVQKNPDILNALAGENPLPDMIMVPLYGTDITILWNRIQEFRDVFDTVQSFDSLRSRLKKLQNSLQEIDRIVTILSVFV